MKPLGVRTNKIYGTEEYRRWNAARMRGYRQGPYGIREYVRRRKRELENERERIASALEDNRKEQEWLQTNS